MTQTGRGMKKEKAYILQQNLSMTLKSSEILAGFSNYAHSECGLIECSKGTASCEITTDFLCYQEGRIQKNRPINRWLEMD